VSFTSACNSQIPSTNSNSHSSLISPYLIYLILGSPPTGSEIWGIESLGFCVLQSRPKRRFFPGSRFLPQVFNVREQTDKSLCRGEKTAEALESNLTSLEKKIDDLLASFEESERLKVEEANARQTIRDGKGGDDHGKV